MASETIVGIFDSVGGAERAKAALMDSGVASNRIAISANLTEDAIAAEAPGQSYENQTYRGSDMLTGLGWLRSLIGRKASTDTERARYNEAVRTGGCVLSVVSESGDTRNRLENLMRRLGARVTMERPDS